MGKWQAGELNAEYIVYNKGLIGQMKFISNSDSYRLEEICVEKYDNDNLKLIFTTHPDSTNMHKQDGDFSRVAHSSLFRELNAITAKNHLELETTNEYVHQITVGRGQERCLTQVLNALEVYDTSLKDIDNKLRGYIQPHSMDVAEIDKAIKHHKERGKLLTESLAFNNKKSATPRKRASAKKPKTTTTTAKAKPRARTKTKTRTKKRG